jgi:hypothetical protein
MGCWVRSDPAVGLARRFELRPIFCRAVVLAVLGASAAGQVGDPGQAGTVLASGSPVKYQITATVTGYCPVQRSVNLHQVIFDLHNASCQDRRHVTERKVPTLPNGPRYKDVRIAGYHFTDWSDGHSSPDTRPRVKIEVTHTATSLSASGWLGKASCNAGPSGKRLVQDTFWQAKLVPEVQFVEDEGHTAAPVIAEILPPQVTAIERLSASCADHEQTLQYSVTPILGGVAQSSIYTSPRMASKKTGVENDGTLDGMSIHSDWSAPSADGETELRVTILQSGSESAKPTNAPAH